VGKIDNLNGFKENVITGHLIPAGTGTEKMQSIKLKYLGTEIEPEPEAVNDNDEQSIESIQAAWRGGAAASEEDDMLPDEAKETLVDADEFADEFGDTGAVEGEGGEDEN